MAVTSHYQTLRHWSSLLVAGTPALQSAIRGPLIWNIRAEFGQRLNSFVT
jgi:hypothetical protein